MGSWGGRGGGAEIGGRKGGDGGGGGGGGWGGCRGEKGEGGVEGVGCAQAKYGVHKEAFVPILEAWWPCECVCVCVYCIWG